MAFNHRGPVKIEEDVADLQAAAGLSRMAAEVAVGWASARRQIEEYSFFLGVLTDTVKPCDCRAP